MYETPSTGPANPVESQKNKLNPVRAVLDTNILVSALLFTRGRLEPLRLAWSAGVIVPLVSTATTKELIRVLSYPKFKLTAADSNELLADSLSHCETVRMPARAPAVPHCRDSFDLQFLHLAAYAGADYLVTGDKDLLEIRDKTRYSIVTADEFMTTLDNRK